MDAFRELKATTTLEERWRLVRLINAIRSQIRMRDEEVTMLVMAENPKVFWEVICERSFQEHLETQLEDACMNTQEVEDFPALYSSTVKDYLARRGRYELRPYNNAEERHARHEMERYYKLETAETTKGQQGRSTPDPSLGAPEGVDGGSVWTPERVDQDHVGSPEGAAGGRMYDPRKVDMDGAGLGAGSIRVIPYGAKGSPSELMVLLASGPGRVAPPEGYGVVGEDGGAGLPIPEGCSSTARPDGQDGQSHPGDC